jgi:hypothetical protein
LVLLVVTVACQAEEIASTLPPPTVAPTILAELIVDVPPTVSAESSPTSKSKTADADVLRVRAVQTTNDTWTFHVTVFHPDVGWEDYADGWDVVLPNGTVVKPDASSPFTRLLTHPHENEQPFTRSQSGIVIPAEITEVRVRAHDLIDGFGGRETVVNLTATSGSDFSVERP